WQLYWGLSPSTGQVLQSPLLWTRSPQTVYTLMSSSVGHTIKLHVQFRASNKTQKTSHAGNMADSAGALSSDVCGLKEFVKEQIESLHVSLASSFQRNFTELRADVGDLKMEQQKLGKSFELFQGQLQKLEIELGSLHSEVGLLCNKLAEQEDEERRNNVRIVGVPEDVEKGNLLGFLALQWPKWFPDLSNFSPEVMRAHRVSAGGGDGLLHFEGWKILFFADYSAQTAQARKAMSPVLKKVQEAGVPAVLLYPAKAHLSFVGNQYHSFIYFSPELLIWRHRRIVLLLVPQGLVLVEINHKQDPITRSATSLSSSNNVKI
uniref:Uncharacterized protein n=1 Tax=Paramormyrops kingsleyae TaxID=1676925 RepID=A0A3B3SV05_9TELE